MENEAQQIMQSDLPNALQLTWLAMWSEAEGHIYADTLAHVAELRGVSRQAISQQLERLCSWGAAERVRGAVKLKVDVVKPRVDDDKPEVDNDRKGFPRSSLRFSPKKVHSTPFSPSHLTPSQRRVSAANAPLPSWVKRLVEISAWSAEPLPDDHPALWDYHPGDWRWEAANYILRELWGDQRLPSRLNRRLEEGEVRPGAVASKWADTFRLLVEQDGYTREVIRHTVQWLFQVDGWWIESGNFQSASNSALRSRDQDGTHKFDKLVQRARSHYEQQKRQQTNPSEVRQGWDDAIEEYEQNHASDTSGDAIPSEPEVGGAAV
jgi:hypothetical protein